MSAAPDIFLSYNREDAEVARRFAEGFEAQGFDVWWDQALRSGEAYDKVTESALRGARAVVVLWSPRSVDSRWVRAEATIAERGGTLVPVRIEPCDLPVMFELTQTADLSHWQGAADDRAWLAFVGDVQRMVGKEEPAPAASTDPAPAATESGIPIVAVLPITCRGGGEEMEFLAEDLTEEITRELPRNSYFEVIAGGTMAAWRGEQIDYRTLGRELDARYLAEGKLQRSGENVRLMMQIIDTKANKMIWSKRFVRTADEIDASPEQVAAIVSSEINVNLFMIELNRAMAKPGNCSGWEHLLRTFAYFGRLGSDSSRRAIGEARQAVAALPDLGMAHSALATALAGRLNGEGEELNDAERREIREHVTRALQLDGNNPRVVAYLVPAYVALEDTETALILGRRGVEISPSSTNAYLVLGYAIMAAGHIEDAIDVLERLDGLAYHDISRYAALAWLGMCYFLESKPAEAKGALDRSLALHPEFHQALKWKAIVAAHTGDDETAHATMRRLKEVEPNKSIDQHVRQMMTFSGLADRLAEPVAILRRLWAETEDDG